MYDEELEVRESRMLGTLGVLGLVVVFFWAFFWLSPRIMERNTAQQGPQGREAAQREAEIAERMLKNYEGPGQYLGPKRERRQ